jgi:hypothetical protein
MPCCGCGRSDWCSPDSRSVRVLAPSRPHQIALSTAIVYQQLCCNCDCNCDCGCGCGCDTTAGDVWDSAGGGAQRAWSSRQEHRGGLASADEQQEGAMQLRAKLRLGEPSAIRREGDCGLVLSRLRAARRPVLCSLCAVFCTVCCRCYAGRLLDAARQRLPICQARSMCDSDSDSDLPPAELSHAVRRAFFVTDPRRKRQASSYPKAVSMLVNSCGALSSMQSSRSRSPPWNVSFASALYRSSLDPDQKDSLHAVSRVMR